MEYLTQKEFKKMALLSYQKIERQKEEINKINVFPVPDQDTGTNLAKTLAGIKNVIEGKEFKNLSEISETVLDGALAAAQGNAGVIYTGFLAGFLPLFNKNPVNAKKLALAFEKGAERARLSIQNPKEGTILDVIDAASQSFKEGAEKESNIIILFKMAVEKAKEALLATREKMEIFKKANVVDAGGLGFLIILESYLEALEPVLAKAQAGEEKPSEKIKRFVQIISNRYEIVSLLENPRPIGRGSPEAARLSEEKIKERLKRLGDSIDVVQIGNKIKLHIHTDYPEEVRDVIRQFGRISAIRIEDMAREVVGLESVRRISIGVVTDEVADLTQKIVERHQIETVPYKLDWPEGEDLAGLNIYQKMEEADKLGVKNPPKTSQATPKDFLSAYQKQLQKPSTRAKLGAGLVQHRNEVSGAGFEKVLCLTISSKLSGGYNSACQAREMLSEEEKKRVFVLDSLNATAGQALLVLEAIELIQSQMEIEEILEELKKEIPDVKLYAFIQDPKWLEKRGRCTPSQANWMRRLQKFGLRPLIGLKNGKLVKIGFRFGVKEIPEAIFREIESKSKKIREMGKRIRVVITHADNLIEAKKLKEKLKGIGAEISFINLTSPVVGVHIGPGSLIAAWMPLE